jgi:hypothetical protein
VAEFWNPTGYGSGTDGPLPETGLIGTLLMPDGWRAREAAQDAEFIA